MTSQDVLIGVLEAYRDGIEEMLLQPAWGHIDDPIEKAARAMTRHHIGSLVVLSGGKLAGIITESDIIARIFSTV